jgi:hypothetical protein
MSNLNRYTEEDLLALNSMVDARNNNVNNFPINVIDPQGITEIIEVPITYSINKFIKFLSPYGRDGTMRYLIYREYLENVPLYINKPDNLGLVAKWRLQIGK